MRGVDTDSVMLRTSDVFYKGLKGEGVDEHNKFNKDSSLNMQSTHYKFGNNLNGMHSEKQDQYK